MSCRRTSFCTSVILITSFVLALVRVDAVFADVKLPAIISDNMVLQQGVKVSIWGWAEPGENISISVTWSNMGYGAAAGETGQWRTVLRTPEMTEIASEGVHEIIITSNKSENKIRVKNVLIGEVWLCSGQSNMVFPVGKRERWKTGVIDYEKEIAAADYPKIRMFTVKRNSEEQPMSDCVGEWKVCSPDTVGDFSAVGYYFGKEIHKELDVPVGLINASVGGTPAEAWTKREVLEAEPELRAILQRYDKLVENYPKARAEYKQKLDEWREAGRKAKEQGTEPPAKPVSPRKPGDRFAPSGLYNGMIAPLIPYGIRGVIWYQGEADAGEADAPRAYQYRTLFPAMIKNWRSDWSRGDFPFYFVQLANFQDKQQKPFESSWAELREAQLMTLSVVNTGMAVTIDIGNPKDIHPRNKQDVGKRLALWALAGTYGKDLVYSGPIYKSMQAEGDKIVLHFDHIGSGLAAGGDGALEGFAVAVADRKFVCADARIDGNTVVVGSDEVSQPVAVRYGWADSPVCNLYNKEGLPASPFRTDDWPGVTASEK